MKNLQKKLHWDLFYQATKTITYQTSHGDISYVKHSLQFKISSYISIRQAIRNSEKFDTSDTRLFLTEPNKDRPMMLVNNH